MGDASKIEWTDATYRWAARNAHPDHGGTTERFAAIAAARDLLLGALG